MAESESGSWSQGWGGSSWGDSSWFDDPGGKSWSRSAWSIQQPQEEPAAFGDPWATRAARISAEAAKVEEVSELPTKEATVLPVAECCTEELAEERRRRIEAEAALAEERSGRERAESELRRRVEDLEKRLAATEASTLEAANARAAAEAEAATARASAESANAEVARLKASAVASAEAMRERTNASAEDWWTSNASHSKGDSWSTGWSSSTWPSPPDTDSWQRWSSWSSSPERSAGSVGREGFEAVENQRPDAVALHEAEVTRLAAHEEAPAVQTSKSHEEAEPESESTPEIARQEEKRHPHDNEAEDGRQASSEKWPVENQSSSESQSAPPEDSSKAYQNEEWYQKWLRRQKNKPHQIIELGVDKPQEQQGGQQEEQASQEAETVAPASQPEEAGKKGYENEEWYQKWLRRQKNKGREIIEIGNDRPQEPEEPEDPAAEQRLDPDDGKTYSWKGLSKKYKGHFSADEVKAYWESDCKVVEASGESAAVENAAPQKDDATDQKAEVSIANEPSDTGEAKPGEPEKKPYEQEEWYQKWLRRQANKDRKIIQIG